MISAALHWRALDRIPQMSTGSWNPARPNRCENVQEQFYALGSSFRRRQLVPEQSRKLRRGPSGTKQISLCFRAAFGAGDSRWRDKNRTKVSNAIRKVSNAERVVR